MNTRPRGSIFTAASTAIINNGDGLLGPNSIIVVYVDAASDPEPTVRTPTTAYGKPASKLP